MSKQFQQLFVGTQAVPGSLGPIVSVMGLDDTVDPVARTGASFQSARGVSGLSCSTAGASGAGPAGRRASSAKATARDSKLPVIVVLVIGAVAVIGLGDWSLLGFSLTGYAWLLPFLVAVLVILARPVRVTSPVLLWLPWVVFVFASMALTQQPGAIQRSVMIVCPIVVGMAISTSYVSATSCARLLRAARFLAIFLVGATIVRSGLLVTGVLPDYGLAAPLVITLVLLAAIFAATYAFGDKASLKWWLGIQFAAMVALSRMPMLASGLSLPLTLAPLRVKRRLAVLAAVLAGGTILFSTGRVQERMFYSGEGGLNDLSLGNPNLRTSGRSAIWQVMEAEIPREPWFGHGGNASETLVLDLTDRVLTHPHNDWLRLAYDYGYVGTGLFVVCSIFQAVHALRRARAANGPPRVLFIAGASSFLLFGILMLTDNVILYAAFFGNLQFSILGLAYAAGRKPWGQASRGFATRSQKSKGPSTRQFRGGDSWHSTGRR